MKVFFGQLGQSTALILAGIARLSKLFRDVLRYTFTGTVRSKALFEQMVLAGVDSLVIICLVGTAVGMVLALQSAYQLKDIGMEIYTGSLVAVSVTRELGPLMAAIIISGRIGARMAAELGTMKVQEEIDALVTMGLNPVRFLVVPRCLSLFVMLPCLTIITMWMAMVGGFLIGTVGVGINPDVYISKSFEALVMKDVYSGLFKSCVFAILVALISCHQGLAVEGGADGVGKATTQAVVTSIVMIIIFDALTTAILYYALPA